MIAQNDKKNSLEIRHNHDKFSTEIPLWNLQA